jgi:hypothetical protein
MTSKLTKAQKRETKKNIKMRVSGKSVLKLKKIIEEKIKKRRKK